MIKVEFIASYQLSGSDDRNLKYINRGDSLKKWKDGTYKLSGLEGVIVEGKTLKELLINLVKKEV